ncbi:flagellar basal body rod protein FlgG [Pandoraea eparura]|jgi:flagellar basal-body rod protein FlgG|uniref:Flagellar basal-body rod protein FlgG n=1 Tax=Pandoraea eparura TaxID=2508291 RepID=A0A5E4VDH1_9BURK|nr:flagellar basal-body rod protein FlgG [Pandoraea eparura]VVE10338.1 flagellar basal body rod protein FlgG [Pandoraea eparura]
MNPALLIARTAVHAQDAQLQTIANNLANVNTTGFKRDRLAFEDTFYRAVRPAGARTQGDATLPGGMYFGTGVRIAGTQKQFINGTEQDTQNALDVAITGRGFLQVEMPDGETAYTRAGNLRLDADGRMVTQAGHPLVGDIVVPPGARDLTISADGDVSATQTGDTEPTSLGRLQLADFVNPSGLRPMGSNLFAETVASGPAIEGNPGEENLGLLRQKALEGSNVVAIEEMVNMITAQRAYEMSTKVLSAADNMMQSLAQVAR